MRNSRVKWAQWMRDINKDLTDMSVCACRGSYWSRWSVRARWTMQLMSWWSYCRVHCLIYHSSAQCVAMNNWSATACISYRLVCLNAESLIKLATHTDTHTQTDRLTVILLISLICVSVSLALAVCRRRNECESFDGKLEQEERKKDN